LRVEFDHFSTGYSEITPFDLGLSMLRFVRLDSTAKKKGLQKLKDNPDLIGKSVSFASYKALYDFLYVVDDFSSALKLFRIAKHSVSKGKFTFIQYFQVKRRHREIPQLRVPFSFVRLSVIPANFPCTSHSDVDRWTGKGYAQCII
uniref:Methyltransf_11 domain-containing protein n=1 Tax=Echinostoma caproni TaxID=27848 RepID=A0A183BF45_9TREM